MKPYFIKQELQKLLRDNNFTIHSFAYEQYYQHLNLSDSEFFLPEIKSIITDSNNLEIKDGQLLHSTSGHKIRNFVEMQQEQGVLIYKLFEIKI